MVTAAPPPAAPNAWRRAWQTAFAVFVLATPFCLGGFVLHSGALAARPLWLDERMTQLVANEPSLGTVLHSLGQGADTNPPLLFAWHWAIGRFSGGVTEWQLRATAFLAMLGAVVGLFLLLRRVYGAPAALAGAFLVSANAQIIRYAFDARFYGPWMLLTVVYLVLLARAVRGRRSIGDTLAMVAAAAALCLIHYFGIITLVLLSSGAALAVFPDRQRMRALWPGVLTGAVVVAALLPMLRGQRAALSVSTWVPPASALLIIPFLAPYLLLYVAAAVTRPAWRPKLRDGAASPELSAISAGLLSLSLLPLLLVAFSFAVQSVMIVRYALPAFLAMGFVGSALYVMLAPGLRAALLVILAAAGIVAASTQASEGQAFATRVRGDSLAVQDALRAGRVVASPSRKELYPLWSTLRSSPGRFVMATVPPSRVRARFPEESDSAGFGNYALLEQDMGRVYARLFGLPHQVSVDSLARLPCFVLLEDQDAPLFVNRWMPDATTTRLQDHIFLVRGPERPQSGDPDHVCDDSAR